jgi:hypothetical protein
MMEELQEFSAAVKPNISDDTETKYTTEQSEINTETDGNTMLSFKWNGNEEVNTITKECPCMDT